MGKALLVLVLGAGLVLTKQMYNATEHEAATAQDQTDYREEVIAREIAQSAFNVGMGEVRAYGERVQQGVLALNGADNAGRSGEHTTGRFADGAYTVKAELTSGHSVRVVATGRFGDAEYTMHDAYRVPSLVARHDGIVTVSFIESMAGYCSAVFYQAYTLDTPEGTVPEPVMLFAPDNRDRRAARPSQSIYVEAGTQMNFFIAVDKNCSEQPDLAATECEVRAAAQDYEFDASDFDHVHYALEVEAGKLDQAVESVWGFVEQHPQDRQRWRIAWEDIHNTAWDRPEATDPRASLQALKRFGYDLVGWPDVDARQYRALRDYGDRPDFSDQVIEIEVVETSDPDFVDLQESVRAQQAACGEDVDDPVVVTPAVTVDSTATAEPQPDPVPDDDLTDFACECRNRGKTPILHRPPGNEANEQLLCLPSSAIVNAHRRNHNDVFPTCTSRRTIRRLNRRNR